MPLCIPESPDFTTGSERLVWERLRDGLGPGDLLVANLRVTDEAKDHELDLLVGLRGHGVVVVEVKGGVVQHRGDGWRQTSQKGGQERTIHPVDQARDGKYAVRRFVETHPAWAEGHRTRVLWAHAVVLPYSQVPQDFSSPDCPRWSLVDRTQMPDLVPALRSLLDRQQSSCRPPDCDDIAVLADVLRARGMPPQDLLGQAEQHEDHVERLSQQQSVILSATRLLRRVEVRGGAGSGKTWLALEQARRLTVAGERVALVCYSHGLASYLRRHVATLPRRQRPAYVGEYHELGKLWGAPSGPPESDRTPAAAQFWETALPETMTRLARDLPHGHRFDAVVVDEAQDIADTWWPSLLASLRDEEDGGVFAFTDEAQQVFSRYGRPSLQLVPLVLDHNLRNTEPIANVFNPLTSMRMRLLGGEGPAVRFVECSGDEVLDRADDEVDALLGAGWPERDVALLTTGSRHPEQMARQEGGHAAYWDSFWDDEQVFYGHVLGFKGLERRAVVLALNERQSRDRSRERLYVGLSRARDQLVVCGDPDFIETVGGPEVLRRLRGQ
jgi:hypothetical protein